METTDFIATLALVTSVVSLTYTVVVDRRRPKLHVMGNIMHEFHRSPIGASQHGPYFCIRATNLGPARVLVNGVCLTHRSGIKRLYRKYVKDDVTRGLVLDTLAESPDKLPKWLEVGETVCLFYPPDAKMLQESEMFDCFYLFDSVGGTHWAPKRVFEKARKSLTGVDANHDVGDGGD